MTNRAGKTLTWNHENRLVSVKNGSTLIEGYLYDESGQRVKKWNNNSTVESGLIYYNARYFDPEIGQFISPDTIVPDPTNLLAYTLPTIPFQVTTTNAIHTWIRQSYAPHDLK